MSSEESSLKSKISNDLKAAMKARDEVGKRTLRMLKADVLKKEVDAGRELTADDELKLLASAVKSRKDSVTEYEKAERHELAAAEREEIEVLLRYLPKPLDEGEARAAIAQLKEELGLSEKKQMGQLMQQVMARYRGQIDGKLASRLAAEALS